MDSSEQRSPRKPIPNRMGFVVSDRTEASWTFAQIPDAVLYSTLSDRAVRLYAVIHKHTTLPGGAFPGRPRLAEMMHVSIDSLDRAIAELELSGFLDVQRRPGTSNVYTLPDPAKVAAAVRLGSSSPAATGSRSRAAGSSRMRAARERSDLRKTDLREKYLSDPYEHLYRRD